MGKKLGALSETEFEVLKVLWEHGPGTVREVHDRLSRWAYTTVQTLLIRLEKKGYVACDRSGFAHVFRPLVSRDKLIRRRLSDLAEQLSDGAATPLVLALVEDHRFSADEIARFRQLLDRLEAEQRRGPEAEKRPTGRGRRRPRPGQT
jgi:BlaI family penicillinase repressor